MISTHVHDERLDIARSGHGLQRRVDAGNSPAIIQQAIQLVHRLTVGSMVENRHQACPFL